ncbi:MAG: hypothetical protein JW908_10710 [Anaerolineales bacterium]|nr:hypothetical protein [Anaerolineales bacterium]
MTSSLDINLLPLAFLDGQEQASLPGLYISTPPRRPARGRQSDRIFLYFIPTSEAQLTAASQEQVLAKLSQMYYKTSGSVTSALRGVAESLNALLLERNVRASSTGQQALGALCQAVVHDDRLYIGLSGPAHAYILASTGVKHFHEPPDVNRILGVGKAASIRYYYSELNPSDTLLLTYLPPSQWTPTMLGGLFGQGPESLRRRLAGFSGADFNAVLMQARSGAGKTFLLRPKPGGIAPLRAEEAASETPQISEETLAAAPEEVVGAVPQESQPSISGASATESIQPESIQDEETATVLESEAVKTIPPPIQEKVMVSEDISGFSGTDAEAARPVSGAKQAGASVRPETLKSPVQKLWSNLLLKIDRGIDRMGVSFSGFFRKVAPVELLPTLPPVVLALIAVLVPIIVVAIASFIYFNSGKQGQYERYLLEAEQFASQASAQAGALTSREEWTNVLESLNQAGKFGDSSQGQALRSQAQTALDDLDGISRLDFEAALASGLPSAVQISRMAASKTELFMLDAQSGNILRVFFTSQGYALDEDFECGPKYLGAGEMGSLVDFSIFSSRSQGTTTLIALDADGNLLECSPGEPPKKSVLTPPPAGLGKPKGFALDQNNFYLLDPEKNAVWIYWRSNFEAQPEFYFGESVPQMSDVIDLTVDQDDLYLLHSDGHVTLCTYSDLSVSPTKCESPVPFLDSRPGRENRILIPETPVTQIFASEPPDPSLYFLEPAKQAIFHMSLRTLTFHDQFRPSAEIKSKSGTIQPASAFALSADSRVMFLAFGNQVYYSQMP